MQTGKNRPLRFHFTKEVSLPMHSRSPAGAALKAAFPHTIPILAGFLFLGMRRSYASR